MTDHPFQVTQYDKFTTVTWPSFTDIRQKVTKLKLMEAAFSHTDAFEVGFVLELDNKEYDIMWVNQTVMMMTDHEYGNYLQDMYTIKGVAYRNKPDATKFFDWLEGKYIWQLLKE
jgi:hypothetical protein